MDLEQIAKSAQACFRSSPVIVLGSGASMPHGLPSMGELAEYLKVNVKVMADEWEPWEDVKASLESGEHLEAALEGKNLPPSLLAKIVRETWNSVNEKDTIAFEAALQAPSCFPLGSLLRHLFQSTNMAVHVVTTNYDRVVEYACNANGLVCNAGFTPGYVQAWQANGIGFVINGQAARLVKIWKVHGSLDWFQQPDDSVVGMPLFSLPPADFTPLIVTPGLNKYEKTHQDPFRSTINGADAALRGASAFLSIGFGFRDQHIHPKIIEACRTKNVPIVVLARTLTEEAKSFLANKAGQQYLGIEASGNDSRVFSAQAPGGTLITDRELWSIDGFLGLVT